MPADILIVNLAALAAVLWVDLGTRQVSRRRAVWPVIVTAVASAIPLGRSQASGSGLALPLAGMASELIVGTVGLRPRHDSSRRRG